MKRSAVGMATGVCVFYIGRAMCGDAAPQAATVGKAAIMTASCGQAGSCKVGDIVTIKLGEKPSEAAKDASFLIRWRVAREDPKESLDWPIDPTFDETSKAFTGRIPEPEGTAAKLLQAYPSSHIALVLVVAKDGRPLASADITLDVTSMYASKLWGLDTLSATCSRDIFHRCTFGEIVALTVPNYRQWIEATGTEAEKVQLMLSGVAIDGVSPVQSCSDAVGPGPCKILFRLLRDPTNEKNMAAWRLIIAGLNNHSTPLSAGLGVSGRTAGKLRELSFDVQRTPPLVLLIYAGLVPFLFLGVCASNLTRDSTVSRLYPQIIDEYCAGPYKNPASLAKTQMALWSIIILLSYLYLWIVSWDYNTLNATALALMGLSAATAVGAKLVDSKSSATFALSPAESKWLSDLGDLGKVYRDADNAPVKNNVTIEAARKAVADHWQSAPPIFMAGTKSYWYNLISGDNESDTQLHRLQMVLFTAFLACAFVLDMLAQLAMPTFSQNVLGLMGISGATYVGFKFAQTQ